MDGSVAPGVKGVTVITGHRDTHFELVEKLEIGASIVVEVINGTMYRFRVTHFESVDSTTSRIGLDSEFPRLVLTTRYPFDARTADSPLRYLVSAVTIDSGSDFHAVSPNSAMP